MLMGAMSDIRTMDPVTGSGSKPQAVGKKNRLPRLHKAKLRFFLSGGDISWNG